MKELSEEEEKNLKILIAGILATRLEDSYEGGFHDSFHNLTPARYHYNLTELTGINPDSYNSPEKTEEIQELLEELYAPKYNRIYA